MDAQYKTDLARLLTQLQPQRLLCMGKPCPPQLADYVAEQQERSLQLLEKDAIPAGLDRLGSFDLIIVINTLEYLDKAAAEHLLARLRDLHGGRLLVTVSLGTQPEQTSRWESDELLAFGMTTLGKSRDEGGEQQHYFFDLYDYKSVPEWLNPRFWAHPERWGKDFW